MTTSGTTAFSLDIAEIIEEAFELAGIELRAGYQFRTARRSLDLLMLEWANRGYNLWLVDEESASVATGTIQVALTTSTIDVIEASISITNGSQVTDYRMRRIPYVDYTHIANKQQTGRPTSYAVERLVSGPVIDLWPKTDQAYTLKYWRLRRIEDTGSAILTPDVPFRFIPALTTGLAHKLACKTPESFDRIPFLEAEAEKQFALAADEDREKSSFFVRPMRSRR